MICLKIDFSLLYTIIFFYIFINGIVKKVFMNIIDLFILNIFKLNKYIL